MILIYIAMLLFRAAPILVLELAKHAIQAQRTDSVIDIWYTAGIILQAFVIQLKIIQCWIFPLIGISACTCTCIKQQYLVLESVGKIGISAALLLCSLR